MSTLLACPLCGHRKAGAAGACASCLAALGDGWEQDEVDGIQLLWLGSYEGATLRAVRAVKFAGRLTLARTVGGLLGGRVAALDWPVGRVVPVPLYRTRRWRRGYDQAERLARGVGASLGVPVRRSLRRVRGTSRQARARAPSRAANVAGAFQGSRTPPVPILLVDDVWTTGATARACAGALLRCGAREVRVAVVARAGTSPRPDPHSGRRLAVRMPNSPPTMT